MVTFRTSRSVAIAIGAAFALGGIACSALFEDPKQCTTDRDCGRFGAGRVCSAQHVCVLQSTAAADGGGAQGGDAGGAPSDASSESPPAAGVLTNITVNPPNTDVKAGKTQQFSAIGRDFASTPLAQQPTFTWTVSGGGTIDKNGLFTAGATPGGPYIVTATSGAITGTANAAVSLTTFTIGETNVLANDDSGNADLLLAQKATLTKPGTIQSLSFYVAQAAGNLRLGIYDASGPNGGPGAKKAETNEFVAAVGWNAVPVVTPVLLPVGDYWLAYAPSDSNLHFELAGDGTGTLVYYSNPYGPMPATFSDAPTSANDHWSFYATLSE